MTNKQKAFVEEYLKDFNATQAAIRAGYSKKTAYSQGQRLLKSIDIASEIEGSLRHRSIFDLPVLRKKVPNKVYFIQAENGLIKIGIATDIQRRLADLDTASPLDLRLLFFIEDENARKLENAFHKLFSKKNIKGEWFRLDNNDIAWIENNYGIIK